VAVAAAGPDAIIHQMTALAGRTDLRRFDRTFATTNQLRTVGTDNLLAAARAAEVRRIVVQSFTGWPNERAGSAIKTEHDPLDPHPPKHQRATMAAIRYVEQAVVDAPIEAVALRYGTFYGPGGSDGEDGLVALIRKRRLPIVGAGTAIWSLIHLDDAAAATVAALERGHGIYNVVDDDPAPVSEVLGTLAELVGAKPPRRLPVWLARLAAGEVGVSLLTQIRGSSNAKARRELEWAPHFRSWRDGFRAELAADTTAARG
jgi:nucleoside-diphosphate-sugar epimerase